MKAKDKKSPEIANDVQEEQLEGQLTFEPDMSAASVDDVPSIPSEETKDGEREPKKKQKSKQQLNTMVDNDLYSKIKQYCSEHGIPIARFVHLATDQFMLDDARNAIPDQATSIDQFDMYMTKIKESYMIALQASQDAYDIAAHDVRTQLQTLQAVTAKNQELDNKLRDQEALYNTLQKQKIDMGADIDTKNKEIEGLKKQLKLVESQKNTAEEQARSAHDKANDAEKNLAKAEADIAKLMAEKFKSEAELTKLETETEKIRVKMDQLLSELTKAEKALEEERAKVTAAAVDQEKLRSLTADNERMMATIDTLNKQIENMQLTHTTQITQLAKIFQDSKTPSSQRGTEEND